MNEKLLATAPDAIARLMHNRKEELYGTIPPNAVLRPSAILAPLVLAMLNFFVSCLTNGPTMMMFAVLAAIAIIPKIVIPQHASSAFCGVSHFL